MVASATTFSFWECIGTFACLSPFGLCIWVAFIKPPKPKEKAPEWARDAAKIKQAPLLGEDRLGYVEAKIERFKHGG